MIRTEKLGKSYGRVDALRDLDLRVEPGEIYGLLGPNGAGKTTTLRLLLDLIRPTAGTISIFGLDLATHSVAIRGRLGYLPGDLVLYPNLTGRQFLDLCTGLRGHRDPGPALRLAERFDLDLARKCGQLSKGNRQKLGVVQAFLHEPELVILDEPASGLDPVVQREFHNHLREYAHGGGTVLFSSHVLSEVEHVADRVGILLDGELAVQDRVDRLKANALRELEFTFAEPVSAQRFATLPGVREATADGTTVRCRVAGTVGELLREAAALPVLNVTSHEPDFEDIFLDYVEGKVHSHVA
ncbi:MAG TPA: ABC transporter ATP-binding protein [Actinophytocola sp.]|uniref:ABC transporter ATP-binding protein n=1 Tax=Actinophytocola sp. TaxID=1872138 RepID=UPI002DBB8E16|nr:ABC transporter ATP-binding protein [Actinophytocola sp.]HEU5469308.1 ABC transporter ATP-binding protein [Actinophytocola sp.]